MLNRKILSSCFLRSYFMGASFNPRGLQNIGLLYTMEPALSEIYKDKEALLQARSRYMWHFNTHPLWVPLLVGMFLNLEQSVRKELLPSQGMVALKNTACYTLSGIGDSVFSGSLIPFWGLLMCCLFVNGFEPAAFILLFLGIAAVQVFRLITFTAGLRYGLGVIEKLRRFDIMLWGDRIKVLNGVLLGVLFYFILPVPERNMDIFIAALGLGGGAWLVFRGKMPRFLVAGLLFLVIWGTDISKLFEISF